MLVSTLNATKKTDNVRSRLHTGQHAGSVSSDHRQGQALVEPLALPGFTRHINKFLCKATQKRGNGNSRNTIAFIEERQVAGSNTDQYTEGD